MAINNPKLNPSLITSITLITSLIFFLITSPTPSFNPHRSLLSHPTSKSSPSPCSSSSSFIQSSSKSNLVNYTYIHTCIFNKDLIFTIPFLIITLILHFYMLIKTAQVHFSNIVTKLCKNLSLSPSMGAVTLLALGNGAPDVFSSMSALNGGNPRTGFGAILSAGMFVSGLVVGFVGILCGPFNVDPFMFVRDLVFYLVAAFFLFFVYLSGELYFWQAVAFVGFYLFFLGFVFWMDFGTWNVGKDSGFIDHGHGHGDGDVIGVSLKHVDRGFKSGVWPLFYDKISKLWEVPVSFLLKLTIPEIEPSKWSRFYQSANIALCPLALLYSCKSFVPMDHPVMFLVPQMRLPLWLVVFLSSSSLATLHYVVEKEPPKTVQTPVIVVAFVMSVFWISNIAGELLSCLAALGALLNLPPSILGLTVLAWGNSMGDLVADVAVAKAGQPALAMAGCFAGPMFNMLVGLGTALVIQTGKVYPEAYQLHFHVSIVVAFVFLFMSLMGSLLVVTWSRFRVPRLWGFCLVGLYAIFIIVSLIIAKFST